MISGSWAGGKGGGNGDRSGSLSSAKFGSRKPVHHGDKTDHHTNVATAAAAAQIATQATAMPTSTSLHEVAECSR